MQFKPEGDPLSGGQQQHAAPSGFPPPVASSSDVRRPAGGLPPADAAQAPPSEREQFLEELERAKFSLQPLAGIGGAATTTPLFAFVWVLAQDVAGRLAALKQTQAEVRQALDAERSGVLGMLSDERRSRAASGHGPSPHALTASVASVSLVAMLQQLDAAVASETAALASWLVQIEGMGVMAVLDSCTNDGSEIVALQGQVPVPVASDGATTAARLAAVLSPLTMSSPVVQHAAQTFVAACGAFSNVAAGTPGAPLQDADSGVLSARTLLGSAGYGISGTPASSPGYTAADLQLLLSCVGRVPT